MECLPMSRRAVDIPICRRLGKVISTPCPVFVYQTCAHEPKMIRKISRMPRILHNHTQPSNLTYRSQLQCEVVEQESFLRIPPKHLPLIDVVLLSSEVLPPPLGSIVEILMLYLFHHRAEFDTREESQYQVILTYIIKQRGLAIVCVLYRLKQVCDVVGFSEVVLYVVVLGRESQFDELVLKCARLLEEAMDFAFYFHNSSVLPPHLPSCVFFVCWSRYWFVFIKVFHIV